MFGVLSIAVRIYQDRWGYGIYSGPIGSAVFIITVKWVRGVLYSNYQNNHSVLSVPFLWILPLLQLQKMKQLRAVYPEKTVYTQQVGPGCCFGALALMLRFYFEVIIKNKCHNLFIPTSLLVMEYMTPSVLCFCNNRSGTTPTSTASTICLWLCPLSCCCQRRIAMQGQDKMPQSSPALLSAAVYVTHIIIDRIELKENGELLMFIILFSNCSLFSPCLLGAPKRAQINRKSLLRRQIGLCGQYPLRNCGNEETAAPHYLFTTPRPPHPSRGQASASLKR